MTNLVLTFAIGLLCGYVFYKIKVPGGMMVGAIVGVALFNIFFDMAYMPSYAKYTAQILAGAYIGCSVQKEDIRRIKKLIKPSLVLVLGMLITNIFIGFIVYLISPLDLITALMSCVPGGMTEIPIISADMGADMPKVAVLQFIRMLSCIGLLPSIISHIGNKNYDTENKTVVLSQERKKSVDIKKFIFTIAIAVSGGMVGKILAIPAGILLFSMIGTIYINIFLNKSYMPLWAKRLAQVLSGAFIGCSIDYKNVLELKYIIIPSIIIVLGYFINCFVVGKILNKAFKIPIKESMLAATPAGATDMALISSDIGVYSTDLVVLQIVRLITVISIFPQVIYFISRWFN
ncbi:AbrB family transcriptional regulator [Lutispora sp.]|uniref:AbrB family transcriptional regulator n=1 Tax=Lutispora sp. TaxID=2828727 RepID=UPI00356A717E